MTEKYIEAYSRSPANPPENASWFSCCVSKAWTWSTFQLPSSWQDPVTQTTSPGKVVQVTLKVQFRFIVTLQFSYPRVGEQSVDVWKIILRSCTSLTAPSFVGQPCPRLESTVPCKLKLDLSSCVLYMRGSITLSRVDLQYAMWGVEVATKAGRTPFLAHQQMS
jgi:hypothetical protein